MDLRDASGSKNQSEICVYFHCAALYLYFYLYLCLYFHCTHWQRLVSAVVTCVTGKVIVFVFIIVSVFVSVFIFIFVFVFSLLALAEAGQCGGDLYEQKGLR